VDMSVTSVIFVESAKTTTSCTLTKTAGTVVSGNVIIFHAEAY